MGVLLRGCKNVGRRAACFPILSDQPTQSMPVRMPVRASIANDRQRGATLARPWLPAKGAHHKVILSVLITWFCWTHSRGPLSLSCDLQPQGRKVSVSVSQSWSRPGQQAKPGDACPVLCTVIKSRISPCLWCLA